MVCKKTVLVVLVGLVVLVLVVLVLVVLVAVVSSFCLFLRTYIPRASFKVMYDARTQLARTNGPESALKPKNFPYQSAINQLTSCKQLPTVANSCKHGRQR